MPDISANEVWFVTGIQHLYGPETLATVAEHSAAIAAALDAAPRDPGQGRRQAGPDRRRRDPEAVPGGERERRMRRPRHLDAHVLAGQDVDRRPGWPPEAIPPPAHAVQRRDPLGHDRHGLHEPEPGRPRRPRVRVHRGPAAARTEGGGRALGRRVGPGPDRRLDTSGECPEGLAGGRIARFGDNMREVAVTEGDKVEAQRRLGFSINCYGVGDLVARSTTPSERRDRLVPPISTNTMSAPTSARRRPRRSLARRRADRARAAVVPLRRRVHRLHDDFEDLHGLTSCPVWRSSD